MGMSLNDECTGSKPSVLRHFKATSGFLTTPDRQSCLFWDEIGKWPLVNTDQRENDCICEMFAHVWDQLGQKTTACTIRRCEKISLKA